MTTVSKAKPAQAIPENVRQTFAASMKNEKDLTQKTPPASLPSNPNRVKESVVGRS